MMAVERFPNVLKPRLCGLSVHIRNAKLFNPNNSPNFKLRVEAIIVFKTTGYGVTPVAALMLVNDL